MFTLQLTLDDLQPDSPERRDTDYQRAIADRLRAEPDYVPTVDGRPRWIVYGPRLGHCELVTTDSCSCVGYRALGHCEHHELIVRMISEPVSPVEVSS